MTNDELVTRLTAIKDMSQNVTDSLSALIEDVDMDIEPMPPDTDTSDPSNRWGGKELPTAKNNISASNRDQALDRVAAAKPGDHIFLPRNVDLQSFTMSCKGTAENPIVLRFEEDTPSPNNGPKANLTLAGEYCVAWGINILDRKLSIKGKGNIVRRTLISNGNYIDGSKHGAAAIINGKDCWIEYFDMHNVKGRGIRTETEARGGGILHGYIHDFNVKANDQTYEPVQLGEGSNTFRAVTDPVNGFLMGWCYVEQCNQQNNENECPSVKWPFCIVRDTHLKDARNVQLRFARNAKLYRVRVEGNGFFGIQGPDHYFENCVTPHECGFRLFMGNWDSDRAGVPPSGSGSAPPQYPSVVRAVFTGCSGNVEVGYKPENDCTIRVQEVAIHAHQSGAIKNLQGGNPAWTSISSPLVPVVDAARYTPASQGLTVPCQW